MILYLHVRRFKCSLQLKVFILSTDKLFLSVYHQMFTYFVNEFYRFYFAFPLFAIVFIFYVFAIEIVYLYLHKI